MRQAVDAVSVQTRFRDLEQTLDQLVAKPLQADRLFRRNQFERLGKPNGAGDVFRSWPQVELLKASIHPLAEGCTLAHVQSPDTPGAVDQVRGHGDQVHGDLAHVQGDARETVSRIGMEQRPFFPADSADGS